MQKISLVVRSSILDLRREPVAATMKAHSKDILQETQLLYNEPLYGYERQGNWIHVEAPMQPKCIQGNLWQGYHGWVQVQQVVVVDEFMEKNLVVNVPWTTVHRYPEGTSPIVDVCMGTQLTSRDLPFDGWYKLHLPDGTTGYIPSVHVMPLAENPPSSGWREQLMFYGKQLLGGPYLWGGRSVHYAYWNEIQTGIDCSGLVHLLYSMCGKVIPRDAHDQYLQSTPLEFKDLQPADLVFFASKESSQPRMNHVMLYIGQGMLLEAAALCGKTRLISFEERCGQPIEDCHQGDNFKDTLLFAGSFP